MRRPRLAVAVIVVAVVAAAAIGLTLSASGDDRDLAFSNGVSAFRIGGYLWGEGIVCQRDVHVEQAFDSVQSLLGGTPPERPLDVTVTRSGTSAVLARGVVARGWAKGLNRRTVATTPLSHRVPRGGSVNVCFRQKGNDQQAIVLAGNVDGDGDPGHAVVVGHGGRHLNFHTDIHLVFLRRPGESVLSQIPAIFRRAALFRPSFVGAWTYWVLLGLVLLVVPALLVRALWAAERESPDAPG